MSGGWKKASFEKLSWRQIVALIITPAIIAAEIGHPVTVTKTTSGLTIEISGYTVDDDGVVIEAEKVQS